MPLPEDAYPEREHREAPKIRNVPRLGFYEWYDFCGEPCPFCGKLPVTYRVETGFVSWSDEEHGWTTTA